MHLRAEDHPQWNAYALPAGIPLGSPYRAGIGLKPQHFREILESSPDIGFVEIHAENYMVDGGPFHHFLGRIRDRYPLSVHGVGLSLAGEEAVDENHLTRLAVLLERYEPELFSEHLAWSGHSGVFFNDLLPIAYDKKTLDRVCAHVNRVQDRLKRRMLVENPATYLAFSASTMEETTFLRELVRRTGCRLLLDVNNVYVSCANHGRDAMTYIDNLPLRAVAEIHLAGFSRDTDEAGQTLLVDSHCSPVDVRVWALFEAVIARVGPMPTLIERDANVPPLTDLLAEARRAENRLSSPVGPTPEPGLWELA